MIKLDQLTEVQSTMEKPYYLVYARKSEESEDRQVQSIPDQVRILTELASNKNLQILEIFSESKSAKVPDKRTEFIKMLKLLETRDDIAGILVWRPNRLARNEKEGGALIYQVRLGLKLRTPEKTYGENDILEISIEFYSASQFSHNLSKDVKRGLKTKLEMGIAPRFAPFGYRNTPEKRQGEKTIEPSEYFPLVRRLFELFLTGNYSVSALHREAVKLGIKNNRNRVIGQTQIYKALRDPFYTGTRYYYSGKLYTNGIHKRMITDEEFERIQEILDNNSRPRGQTRDNLLTGVFSCGECQRSITAEIKHKKLKDGTVNEHTYYHCTKKNTDCKQPSITEEDLFKQVDKYLSKVELDPEYVQWAKKWLLEINNEKNEIRKLKELQIRQGIDGAREKLDRLYDLMIEGTIDKETGESKKQELLLQRQSLQEQSQRIDEYSDDVSELTIKTFEFVTTARQLFRDGSLTQRKTILNVLGSNREIKDKKLQISLNKPFERINKVVMQFSKITEAKFSRNEANMGALGSNFDLMSGLPNEVRTYFSTITPQQILPYKTSFEILNP